MKPLFILTTLLLFGCSTKTSDTLTLSSIQIIDRNEISETISNDQRLKLMEQNDFFSPQPYKKVTRTYRKNTFGKTPGHITTYHPNGQLYQSLETLDGRAYGRYREYFPSGNLRLDACIIEGVGDTSQSAQDDWLFDGLSRAWDDEGHLIAEIPYVKGYLDGLALYFMPNGKVHRSAPYSKGKQHGTTSLYDSEGQLIGSQAFVEGLAHGRHHFVGNAFEPANREQYDQGALMEATYFDLDGRIVAQIRNGNGQKALFEKGKLRTTITYQNGLPEGEVQVFRSDGSLESKHILVDGKKHGEEWLYFDTPDKPKMLITWYQDEIHGTVKTWYEDGSIQNEREMSHNKRHGHSFAWYEDGSLMLIENYNQGKLVKGSYLKRGVKEAISTVTDGNGTATLHDANGIHLQSIIYKQGHPVE
ncbi:MAG: hypothetical protein KDK50_06095 [Chlamydiia bacterium]|nr:hypothetical protein [Chlamydiia bacterium]